jgi:hypothetical protein
VAGGVPFVACTVGASLGGVAVIAGALGIEPGFVVFVFEVGFAAGIPLEVEAGAGFVAVPPPAVPVLAGPCGEGSSTGTEPEQAMAPWIVATAEMT